MNFVNQIKILLIYLLLFNHQIFGMMQNKIDPDESVNIMAEGLKRIYAKNSELYETSAGSKNVKNPGNNVILKRNKKKKATTALDLDKEYTNLLLLSNFDSVKKPGIEEDQIVLERRMQFRLIAWNFAEKYGLEKEKKKITKGKIEDMIKYACELWTKTVLEEEYQKDKIKHPELLNQENKALLQQFEETPFSMTDMVKNLTGDCLRLEFHLDDKSDPYEEMPKWVDKFFKSVNQIHLEKIKQLLSGKNLDDNNFEFWWKKFLKRKQEMSDEKELKKSLELEEVEAKMGRSKAIVLIRGKMKEIIPLEDDGRGNEESQFLREMRKLAINSITKDGQEVLKLVKRQIIKMTSANTLMNLERFHPTLLGIGIIEEQLALALYKNVIKKTNELELIFWEFRISAAIFHGRIWRKLFEKLFDNRANNEEEVRVHFQQLFEISKKFNLFKNLTIIDKINAQKMCLELWRLWRKIMGEDDSENEVETREEHFEENRMKIRNELLWKEHWAWLDLLKKMDKQLLDSNFSPGNIYKFSEFFGGFEQIWSKIIEMEKSGQKPFQLDGIVDTENENFTGENFIDKMLAPFRTKLSDLRIIYNIENYFLILLLHEKGDILIQKFMWKTTPDIRRVIWGLDLLIWMLILDEQIDQISTENDDQKLVNAWWNVRVEMEIFHDSLTIRAGGFEGVEKPALYMLNWMYLLKHQKCITKNITGGKTYIGEFDENMKEENRNEINKNLINYIDKCKKISKEYTEKEKKHFDDDEMRKWRYFYLMQLISEGGRFFSPYIAMSLEERIEDEETMKKIKKYIGNEFLAELSEKSSKNLGRRYLVEKWIEIFQIPDKNIQFQASLDFMYLYAKFDLYNSKYYTQKHQLIPIAYQREYARNTYDTITRIEQQVAKVLGEESEEDEGKFPSTSRTKHIGKSTDLSRQINMIRSIKMINELSKEIVEASRSMIFPDFSTIQMVSSKFVLENFHLVVEELRNFHMKNMNYKRFAHVLQSNSEMKKLINEMGTVYRLNILLGYNEVDKKRNIEKIWEEASKGDNKIGSNLANPLQDINFFNDKRLMENYESALKNYKVKGEISPTIMYSLAANILVFMQYFELIGKKYGEQIRLFARIEYDKLLTDFGQVNFRVQREFFTRLLAEIKNTTRKEISEILSNYRLEKIAMENENDKLFVDYDEHLQKLHYEAFLRLVWQEKEVEVENKDKKKEAEVENKGKKEEAEVENKDKKKEAEVENKGKKEVNESSIAKILIDANSDQRKRQILFNFMGNFERIANVFNQIGPHGIKIQAKNYAHFEKGKEAAEEIGTRNEQHLPIAIQGPLPEAENLGRPQFVGAGQQQNLNLEKAKKGKNLMAEEATSSSAPAKGKKKKKAKKVKKNKENPQKNEKKEEIEKSGDEQQEEVGEMVILPSNEILKEKMQDGHKMPSFENYFDDQFLYNKFLVIYENFIAEQKWSPEEHLFLTVGIYLNEISHKFAALDGMKKGKMLLANSIDWKLVEEMQRELAELKLNEKTEWTLEEVNVLITKLHDIFTKLLAQMDGYSSVGKENEDEELYDQIYLRLQLNFICFARAICEDKKLEQIWSDKNEVQPTYNRNFVFLIGHPPIVVAEKRDNENHHVLNALEKLRAQFEKEYLVPYKQMLEQNKIDHQLLDEYWPKNSAPKNTIPIDFNKFGQQFRWSSEQFRQSQQIRNRVYNVIVKDEEDETEGPSNRRRYQHIDAIHQIEHIITKIWAPQSTLKIGGAYQLGTWTPSSEIDAILLASKRVGKARFFGKSICESNRRCSDIDSLFCQLCQNKKIFTLIRRPNNHIPHIKFIYCANFKRNQMRIDWNKLPANQCVRFELVLVSLPGYGIISERTLQNTQFLIDQFRENWEEDIYEIDWNDSRAGMIFALSRYQLNEFILSKLVNQNMLEVFRICLMALNKWAQKNHIYGGPYGLMNGASLGLMLLKIVLRFPLTPMVPFILEQFFTHFVNWPWPMPVQFAPLGEDRTEADQKKLGWQAEREKGQKQKMWRIKVVGWQHLPTLTMPIISPCKPERNMAYSVNHSTQQIIQRQLQLGLEMIVKIREQQQPQNRHALIEHHEGGNAKKYSWKSLLNGNKTFGQKYTHYIVFYCFAKTSSTSAEQRYFGEKFCSDYIFYRLRLELIFTVERNPSTGILRCHILPNINMGYQQKKDLNELSENLLAVPPEFKNLLNRYWVIGLEFVDEAIQGKVGNNAATEKLENWLNKSPNGFVENFKHGYFQFAMRKHSKAEIYKKMANIHLYAKFVQADQLSKWIIHQI